MFIIRKVVSWTRIVLNLISPGFDQCAAAGRLGTVKCRRRQSAGLQIRNPGEFLRVHVKKGTGWTKQVCTNMNTTCA
jgi:hypothetical protein